MLRTTLRIAVAIAVLAPIVAMADVASDLQKIHDAFLAAKSFHAVEHFSNGKIVTVDYLVPDRWRIQPAPNVTELVVGNDVYMVRNGKSSRLPFGGAMINKTLDKFKASWAVDEEVKQSAKDLGMQTVNGKSLHGELYT
ncbi:MAG: hypothetical protein ACRD4S_01015 [Candidatus Acidiferrales bacterium]